MDENIKEKILSAIEHVQFGEIKIKLSESAPCVDIEITEKIRFKKRTIPKYIKFEHDKKNIKHEG